ncbi:GNAT family N-acetyltransferase [Bacteroidota bacterium]
MQIKSLTSLSFQEIYDAFAAAFADYDMPMRSPDQLKQMLQRRGMVNELSFGAFDGDKLVSFTFNGIGDWNGMKTAYDTGTGTVKEYRGQGLAKKIFQDSVPVLKENGVKQYLLEVLQHNDKAIPLYTNQGFEITREFDYYVGNIDSFEFPESMEIEGFAIRELKMLPEEMVQKWFDFQTSWQNSFDSIERGREHFKFFGGYIFDKLVSFGVVECNGGDITLIAVDPEYRRKGIGTEILRKLFSEITDEGFQLINTDGSCKSIKRFLEVLGIERDGGQFEMMLSLD